MKKYPLLVILLLGLFILNDTVFAQVPAFPGAEGFGANTAGGRGGTVIKVTNLNNSGSGSLREAVNASGPRIVVFETGGIINLTSGLNITNPYLTIAGQTAPGDGICISGGGIVILTHDIIIRNLRIRPGDQTGAGIDGIRISGNNGIASNIIIDRCSISWATDENFSTYKECQNITVQWCVISEAINTNNNSYGMLIGMDFVHNLSVHHNLFAHQRARHPAVLQNTETEFINNLVYNWQRKATDIRSDAKINIIANRYIDGPETFADWRHGVYIDNNETGMLVYVKDNVGYGRPTNSGNDWLIVNGDSAYRSLTPAIPLSNFTPDQVEDVYDLVLDNVGAIIPDRDAVDNRIVQDVRDSTGNIISSQNEVGGWPNYASGIPPIDTDNDGMPDDWEISHGLNPNDPTDANEDQDGDGYTNIEEYINSFFPDLVGDTTPPDPPVDLRVIENGGDLPSGQEK